ncbi:MAG: cytochrome c biogenesis protein CcsA [Planctomycetaceae bacterium]|nr:cytochrome c biogenesis protein CcsA [Planctomycetaceae bacterium]
MTSSLPINNRVAASLRRQPSESAANSHILRCGARGFGARRAARGFAYLVAASMFVYSAGGATAAEDPATAIDWTPWKALPVYHDGRIMPLDSFARSAVEIICHKEKPEFDPQGTLSADEYKAAEQAGIRSLFPDGKPRKFQSAELVLSWIAEPEKWEQVPFLIAEHEALRKLLELPLVGPRGQKLKYVSPAQIKASDAFQQKLLDLRDRQRQAQAEETQLELDDLDTKFTELVNALELHQQLIFGVTLDVTARKNFDRQMTLTEEIWTKLQGSLGLFQQSDQENGLAGDIKQAQQALQTLSQWNAQNFIPFREVDGPAVSLAQATAKIGREMQALEQRLRDQPPELEADRLATLRKTFGELTAQAQLLSAQAQQLSDSIYENGETLCIVPALRATALEKDRDTMDEAEPWLDLQTIVTASPAALAAYPQTELAAVRGSFERMRKAYAERSVQPAALGKALAEFSDSVRKLGEATEPLRAELPIKNRDDDMLRYTAYPPPSRTATELRYNETNPFFASWIISLLAFFAFGLFVIGIRSRWIYILGMVILLAGLGWAAYGFAMRVKITGWAPVTNMYETVVFVPFVVSLLGAWFALLPLLWPGLKNAWRLSAIPGTWEASPLSAEQLALWQPATWNRGGWLLLLPRVGLALLIGWISAWAPYAAGGRTIINLLPNVDAGQNLPDLNDWITWATGLCVLLPTMWYLPRAILSAVLGTLVVPLSARGQMQHLAPQVMQRWPFALAATFTAFLGACIAWYSPVLPKGFSPLQPVLRDNFWLLIHVLTIVASYGAGALAWGLGNIGLLYYLFGRYRQPTFSVAMAAGHRTAEGAAAHAVPQGNHPPEACAELASYVYKAVQVAVVLLAAGTILGALWADVAWGRFWGWDPKEVWALISLLVYIAILHGRFAGLVGNFGLCVGAVLGASAIIMSWYGVNFVLGVGLHSYGFGAGGQWYVLGGVIANWVLVAFATARYLMETTRVAKVAVQ